MCFSMQASFGHFLSTLNCVGWGMLNCHELSMLWKDLTRLRAKKRPGLGMLDDTDRVPSRERRRILAHSLVFSVIELAV